MRWARTCYDHLAGQAGVAITEALLGGRSLLDWGGDLVLTASGERLLTGLGVDVEAARRSRRRFAFACLDWSERRPHLGGALGAELCRRLFELGWIRRRPGGRAVAITEEGRREAEARLGAGLTPAAG